MPRSYDEDVRRHNLSTVLRLVHRGRPMSRSDLTRLTRLNRSTIAALVAELTSLGLVQEHLPASTNQAGRPSPVVTVSEKLLVLAVTPEVDALTIAVVTLGGKILRRMRYANALTLADTVTTCTAFLDGMRLGQAREQMVVGIGVAVPGTVRASDGLVRSAPTLGWIDEPVGAALSHTTGLPVLVAGDAQLGSMAERHFGVGKGVDDLVYLNGGSGGISGGLVIGGQEVRGAGGLAGGLGRLRVTHSPVTVSSRSTAPVIHAPTLQEVVTRSALLSALDLLTVDGEGLEQALLASTSLAVVEVVREQLSALAAALATLVDVLNPRLIILGGFLASLFAVDPTFLWAALREHASAEACDNVEIKAAELGADLLLIGAAEMVFDRVVEDPASVRGGQAELAAEPPEVTFPEVEPPR